MSSAVVSTSAALGRPFVFDDDTATDVCTLPSANREEPAGVPESSVVRLCRAALKTQQSKIPPARVTPASRLEIRPAPEMVSSGIPAIDAMTGGLPRGCLTEICGPASSGRTTLLLAALAAATRRGECCVVVDASDALDPHSAAAAGVELDRLLWVRCGEDPPKSRTQGRAISRASSVQEAGAREVGASSQVAFDFDRTGWKENGPRQSEHRLEQVLRATDLLLESGGFGLIVLDLGDLPPQAARHIPLTTWFRFRRAIEYTPTILLAIEHHPIAGSCSSLLLKLGSSDPTMPADESAAERRNKIARGERPAIAYPIAGPTPSHLLTGLDITAELIRSRLDRKPARSVAFTTKTAWAG